MKNVEFLFIYKYKGIEVEIVAKSEFDALNILDAQGYSMFDLKLLNVSIYKSE